MKKVVLLLTVVLLLFLLVQPCIAVNVTVQPRIYFTEDVAIPIELWMLMIGIGITILVIAVISHVKTILGLLAFGFFSAAAFASPMVGYFNYYVVNNTTSAAQEFIPTIRLATQPWVMWFLWGMATISFFVMVWGILEYFIEVKEVEESGKWI